MLYFDNAATTRVRPEVVEEINKYMLEEFANPVALYRFGLAQEKNINQARKTLADVLRVDPAGIYFTPGATWSNNLILHSVLSKNDKGAVVTSKTEHSSVYLPILKHDNRKIIYVKLDDYGRVDYEDLEKILLENDVALVSLMHVNNELGSILDLDRAGKIIKKNSKALFHVDGVQGFLKQETHLMASGVDFYTISGHKIHGPKGIGAMYINKDVKLNPYVQGGGQESSMAPGTHNVPGIMGLAKAVEVFSQNLSSYKEQMKEIKNRIIDGISQIEGSRMNSPEDGADNIINVGFEGIKSEILLHMLDDDGVCISSGSACSGGKKSRILEAISLDKKFIDGSIRISLSYLNDIDQVDQLLGYLRKNVESIRKIMVA